MDELVMEYPYRFRIETQAGDAIYINGNMATNGQMIWIKKADGVQPGDVAVDRDSEDRFYIEKVSPVFRANQIQDYVLVVRRLPPKQLMGLSVGPVTISATGGSTSIFNAGSIGDVTNAPNTSASLTDLLKLAGEVPAEYQDLFMELVDQLRAMDKGAEIKPKGFLNRFAPIFETSANTFAAVLSIIASIMTMTS